MKENMSRAEALKKIEELKSYVASIPKNNHPAKYNAGQVYKEKDGDLGMLRSVGIGSSPDNFEYLGIFNEVFTRKAK